MKRHILLLIALCMVEFLAARSSQAQSPAERVVALRVEPAEAEADIGEDLHFKAVALDASGNPVNVPVTWFAVPWDLGSADARGVVRPQAPGLLRVGAKVGDKVAYARVMVRPWRVSQVEIQPSELTVVAEGHAQLSAIPRATNGNPRPEILVEWTSETPAIATVDSAGLVTGVRPGQAMLRAAADGVVSKVEVDVIANPVRQLNITPSTTRARTGDVVHFAAQVPAGVLPRTVQATWSVQGEGAAIWPDGAFVAEKPGTYVVSAEIGSVHAAASIVIVPRNVQRELEVLAHVIPDKNMPYAEQWVFGNTAYLSTIGDKLWVYDISDPRQPKLSGAVAVDARLINDCSVSADGKVGVLTREGTSTRKNGIVFLDTSDPLHPKVASEYTQTVTAGVHSAFLNDHYAYITDDATGALRIIDFSNLTAPKEVARWQLENPIIGTTEYPLGVISSGRFLHDVYVKDGLAYLAYWRERAGDS